MKLNSIASNTLTTITLTIGKKRQIRKGLIQNLENENFTMRIESCLYSNKLTYKYLKRIFEIDIKLGEGINETYFGCLKFDIGDLANNELNEIKGRFPIEECINPGSFLYLKFKLDFPEGNILINLEEDNPPIKSYFRKSITGSSSPNTKRKIIFRTPHENEQNLTFDVPENNNMRRSQEGVTSYKVNMDRSSYGLEKKGSYYKFKVGDDSFHSNENNPIVDKSYSPRGSNQKIHFHIPNPQSPIIEPLENKPYLHFSTADKFEPTSKFNESKFGFSDVKPKKLESNTKIKPKDEIRQRLKTEGEEINNGRLEELLKRVSLLENSVKKMSESNSEQLFMPINLNLANKFSNKKIKKREEMSKTIIEDNSKKESLQKLLSGSKKLYEIIQKRKKPEL